eukprot:10904768-Lingulodinium_polyedra.AAC.1
MCARWAAAAARRGGAVRPAPVAAVRALDASIARAPCRGRSIIYDRACLRAPERPRSARAQRAPT